MKNTYNLSLQYMHYYLETLANERMEKKIRENRVNIWSNSNKRSNEDEGKYIQSKRFPY